MQTSSAASYTISSPDPTGCNKLQVRGQDTFGTWGPYYQTDWLSTNDETLYHTFGGEMVAFQVGDTQHASFTNPTTGVYYPATDHLGSVWAVYDASAALVATTRYYPYGNIATQTGTSPTDLGFTGQEATDFGLLDYHARFYDPYITQFSQPDPIIPDPNNSLDWNRYSYSNNNPINYNDPIGHMPSDGCKYEGCSLPNLDQSRKIVVENLTTNHKSWGDLPQGYKDILIGLGYDAYTYSQSDIVKPSTDVSWSLEDPFNQAYWGSVAAVRVVTAVPVAITWATNYFMVGEDLGNELSQGGKLPTNPGQVMHIFRNATNHIADTIENRQLLLDTVQEQYLRLTDDFGNQWYSKILQDGREVWVEVRNGIIRNGGINETPIHTP